MPANEMNVLLNKIERRLGTRPLNLPDHLTKDKWANEVIANETLDTFSRYFPNKIGIKLDLSQRRRDGWYVIDEYIPAGVKVIGVRDINWSEYSANQIFMQQSNGFGAYNYPINNYNLEDVALLQMRADHMSLFNNQFIVKYKAPNMVRIENVMGCDIARTTGEFPIELFIKHAPNLMTISPTMMETFEKLAQADVATFLFQELKYYEDLETVFANTNMKLDDLKSEADKRDDVVQKLDESYVSAANENQPLIFNV